MLSYSVAVYVILQVFAWLGFAISMVWIYVIANEIVNLLQVECKMYCSSLV